MYRPGVTEKGFGASELGEANFGRYRKKCMVNKCCLFVQIRVSSTINLSRGIAPFLVQILCLMEVSLVSVNFLYKRGYLDVF